MRTKRVIRHYCDFCKKCGGSSFHMKNHEKHCTMNPERECRMCETATGGYPPPMHTLLAVLPDLKKYERPDINMGGVGYNSSLNAVMAASLDTLRDATDGCPACILAALRQKGIPNYIHGFDYQAECKAIWDAHNAEERRLVEDKNDWESAACAQLMSDIAQKEEDHQRQIDLDYNGC